MLIACDKPCCLGGLNPGQVDYPAPIFLFEDISVFPSQQQTYEEIDRRCFEVFGAWEKRLDQERKLMRRMSAKQGARLKAAGEARPSAAGRIKKRRAPRTRLPNAGFQYVGELRIALADLYGSPSSTQEPTRWRWGAHYVHIERGLLHLLFVDGHYALVRDAIRQIWQSDECLAWPNIWNIEVETIWNEAMLHVVHSHKRREDMTPVNTFRIRKKNPSPLQARIGVCKYSIPEKAAGILRNFYAWSASGKPSRAEKLQLVSETGLEFDTVTNWFKNKRQRESKRRFSSSSAASSRVSQASSSSSSSSSSGYSSADGLSPQAVGVTHADPYFCYDELDIDPSKYQIDHYQLEVSLAR